MLWGTYRDNSEHSVDSSSSYGGIDGLSNTSFVKYACRVVKDLKEKAVEEFIFSPLNTISLVFRIRQQATLTYYISYVSYVLLSTVDLANMLASSC